MAEPKISLIIPAFNEEKYIGACLEHVKKSSGENFYEIIVIDNASTDRTSEISKLFEGVKVIREEIKGLTSARQRGLSESSGDIIAYVDADTRMPDWWLKYALDEFNSDPSLVALSGPYVYYDIPAFKRMLVHFYWTILARPIYLFSGYMLVGGNFLIKRDVLLKMGGFDTTIPFYGEDTNIARRASAFGKVKFNLSFWMPTSARRFAGQGWIHTTILYMANFLSEVILRKPVTKKYRDIR